MRSITWNVSYIELRIWNQVSYNHRSYERNLSNCVKKPEKVRISTGFEPVTSRCRCDALTNWAMKPLTLGAGHLWVLMSPWGMDVKWYMKCFIYWTADLKSSKLWSSQLWTQFKQYRCDALTNLERRTGFARSRVQTPLKSWLFQASLRNCLNCVHNCDDHSLLDDVFNLTNVFCI